MAPASLRARPPRKRQPRRPRKDARYWSAEVTRKSNALDLEPDVFKGNSPRAVAQSLKRSADSSQRRKAEPFRSAMSMLVFYINRAGKNLPKSKLRILEKAKEELRELYRKPRRGS
jgi:hypothetical protein